jgi:uncharacterized protein (DUF488 family)
MQRTLFTIGHSTHSLEHFLSLLVKHRIEAVSDVRSTPYSQRNPQFNREPLKLALQKAHIEYVFLGRELGARSDNPACYIDHKVQYNYLVDEPIFQEGLRRLQEGIGRYRVAIMCAERDPLTCHRTILVCRELRTPQLNIEHILADGSIETNREAEIRLMSMLNIQPDMIQDEHECIERAYENQANNIAYVIPQKTKDPNHKWPSEDLYNRLHK